MRRQNVSSTITALSAIAALAMAAVPAGAQILSFTPNDWLLHRGTPTRQAGNNDPGLPNKQVVRTWVYPGTADMLPEMVVDNTAYPVPVPAFVSPPAPYPALTQDFTLAEPAANTWVYPNIADRTGGAWPPNDSNFNKLGDYVYTTPVQSTVLSGIGVSTLAQLPDLSNAVDPVTASNIYKQIHQDLVADTTYARWSFGTTYPYGTYQGTRQISYFNTPTVAAPVDPTDYHVTPLVANQRYAVYIRFPSSGTNDPALGGGTTRPNVDHAMVRVSWGADPNDPIRSRIFQVVLSQTGGAWIRLRTGPGDDRYFPFDGTNPIRVTLYSHTPDDPNDQNEFGAKPIVVADAVRLVPEALRGDIHAAAASALFPLTSLPAARQTQLTYFGRDETTGPFWPKTLADTFDPITKLLTNPSTGISTIGFDPTLPIQNDPSKANFNPAIDDPTASLRSAVFYCVEDDLANQRYGKLRWRYPARSSALRSFTVDDNDGAASFSMTNPALVTTVIANATNQPYNGQYRVATVTPTSPTPDSMTWTQPLPGAPAGSAWSVYVWIPAGTTEDFAHFATYQLTTDIGTVAYTLDQRNTDPTNPNVARTGMWRRLASGIRFPLAAGGVPQGNLTLLLQSQRDIDDGGAARVVVGDAVQFVSESRTSNSVVAAPLVTNVLWPSGTERQVVYFATTDGHVWALDALGVTTPAQPSTYTTAYWVYPSISNPATGLFRDVRDDPNYNPDPSNNRANRGIDGDTAKTTVNGIDVYSPVRGAPPLGAWNSSPALVRVQVSAMPVKYQQYLVIGNQNGRLYAIDPVGRVDGTGNPYPASIAVPDPAGMPGQGSPGIPGTTARLMTWPSAGRDKWLRKTDDITVFGQYSDDPAKGVFQGSLSADVAANDPLNIASKLIVGSGDGHVYAVDISSGGLTPNERISHSTVNNAITDGQPLWLYPDTKNQLDGITQPGSLSTDFARYVFTAGGRVYSIDTTAAPLGNGAPGTPALRWVYPFTSSPPGNPLASDQNRLDTEFTAPVLRAVPNFNGGNESVFIANKDGRIFSFDDTKTGNVANLPIWTSLSQGSTRAGLTFINQLQAQSLYNTRDLNGPRLLLPLDTGAITAVDIVSAVTPPIGGAIVWAYFDALLGAVPLTALDNAGNQTLTFFATSNAYRGADATVANQWIFNGDEGNQDTGEVNGQMRAYGSQDIGLVTPGEPTITPTNGGVELRMVDLWNARRDQVGAALEVWDFFGLPGVPPGSTNPDPAAKSPYTEYLAGHQKKNTKGQFVVYEWGDTIYMAAWGLYAGNALPQVTFTISGATNTTIPAITVPDLAYTGPALTTVTPGVGEQPARPFVAKAQFSLSTGSDAFSQTPGQQYKISAFAQLNAGGAFTRTATIYAGQYDALKQNPNPPPTYLPPVDPNTLQPPRLVAIAHPFAMTTRGAAVGTNLPNIVGWTDNVLADNSTTDFTEIMTNGNSLSTFDAASGLFVPTQLKDLAAPLGFATHGSSIGYSILDNAGNAGPGLLIADRSNLWKNNQKLNRIRVERREMRWGWDRTGNSYTSAIQKATGNVINPLPWETFPNTVPNVSPDYPDITREHATFKLADQNLGSRPIALASPRIDNTTTPAKKFLIPTVIDLSADVPRFQPANVNGHYYDINGNQVSLLNAPMMLSTGLPLDATNPANRNRISPSAGYVGAYAVFVDSNNDGVFEGFAPGLSQGQRASLQAREEVYRQLNVGVAVPPDVNIRTEEETVDIGTVAHSEGYNPGFPFQPSFLGIYSEWVGAPTGVLSPWDKQYALFHPFTVRNQGNVNLVNVRSAKIRGDYLANPANPAYWLFMQSDQVEPVYTFNNPPLAAVPYDFYPQSPNFNTGNIGVVTSLDHRNDANTNTWENDLWTWTAAVNGYRLPTGAGGLTQDYVVNGNVLGWNQFTRRHPTVGKPRPGDTAARTMSIPDTYYGDPLGVLAALKTYDDAKYGPLNDRSLKPQISVAVPLGMPAGTYTMPVYIFEDHVPEQWRSWVYYSRNIAASPDTAAAPAGDDDGILDLPIQSSPANDFLMPEAQSNPFILKVTVAESRLTNGSSAANYVQVDNRGAGTAMGSNVLPVAMRDLKTGNLFLYWPSNRTWDGANNRWSDPGTPDAPWYLYSTQLNSAATPAQYLVNPFFAWHYTAGFGQWWNAMPQTQQYPTATIQQNLFPSQGTDVLATAPQGTPVVPGALNVSSVRHASPALIQDDDGSNANIGTWLFWQGSVNKSSNANMAGAGANFTLDTRTFYVQLANGQAPDPTATPPYSFLNDPALPKYGPKPLILTDQNKNKVAFLFWYGGSQGRTKLYFNSTTNLGNVSTWSADTPLTTPSALLYQADPNPIHRLIYTTWFNPQGELLDCIDVVYTGSLSTRKAPESMMTRYALDYKRDSTGAITDPIPTGKLVVMPAAVTDVTPNLQTPTPKTTWAFSNVDELMSRQGASATYASRDIAWLTNANRWDPTLNQFQRDILDANGKPYVRIRVVNRTGVSTDVLLTNPAPTFDAATNRVYYNSALGGQVVLDPQAGTATFNGVAPRSTDQVLISYTPQTLRMNVSRNDHQAVAAPGGADTLSGVPWASDPGFTPRTHVDPSGSDSGPVAFLDRSGNPRYITDPNRLNENTVNTGPNGAPAPQVTRLWLFFRKSDANVAAPATIYYKTMRLMVRLPRGVLRNPLPNWSVLPNIIVTGNLGPYEVDWIRGRVYFNEVDEGRVVKITFRYARDGMGNALVVPATDYRVGWGDEISSALTPGDATTNERALALSTPVNEGQVSAFKDPFQDKVWIFWSSTRNGTTDLYYMTINPQLYTQPGF